MTEEKRATPCPLMELNIACGISQSKEEDTPIDLEISPSPKKNLSPNAEKLAVNSIKSLKKSSTINAANNLISTCSSPAEKMIEENKSSQPEDKSDNLQNNCPMTPEGARDVPISSIKEVHRTARTVTSKSQENKLKTINISKIPSDISKDIEPPKKDEILMKKKQQQSNASSQMTTTTTDTPVKSVTSKIPLSNRPANQDQAMKKTSPTSLKPSSQTEL